MPPPDPVNTVNPVNLVLFRAMPAIDRTVFRATAAEPVTVYYCKANLRTGLTVRVVQGRNVCDCACVEFSSTLEGPFKAEMIHGNSTGKPKASGARCVLIVRFGLVTPIPVTP